MPILPIMHSSASTEPVTKAMSGMSPSVWVRGIRIWFVPVGGSAVLVHAATLGTTNCRRHRPFWMTSGTFAPEGTFVRVNVPSAAVVAFAIGEPERLALQLLWHETPGVKGCTVVLGT